MSGRTWLGGIYLRAGGHEIVLKALKYYKNKVDNVEKNPLVQEASMNIRPLIIDAGKKTSKKLEILIKIINSGIDKPQMINQLEFEVDLIEKALKCYQDDIKKITNTMQERYIDLFDEPKNLQNDMPLISEAIKEINKFG